MIKHGTRLAAQVEHYGDRTAFYLRNYDNGTPQHAKIEYEPTPEGMWMEPSFSLHMDVAQELFEQMWSQGFRSKHDRGGADRLDAARAEHIADLRRAAKLG